MVRAAWMEKIMSKTNDTSDFGRATLEDHGTLADSELDAVSGGTVPSFGKMIDARKGGAIIVYDYGP
jgi:hypothetical protein